MQLTSEQLDALNQSTDGVIQVRGENGAVIWIMTEEALRIRNQVMVGLEQLDHGDSSRFDPEDIRREGMKRLHPGS